MIWVNAWWSWILPMRSRAMAISLIPASGARATKKTVLKRKAPPTFDLLVEIVERDNLRVYQNVAEAVDQLLRGFEPVLERRTRGSSGAVEISADASVQPPAAGESTRAQM